MNKNRIQGFALVEQPIVSSLTEKALLCLPDQKSVASRLPSILSDLPHQLFSPKLMKVSILLTACSLIAISGLQAYTAEDTAAPPFASPDPYAGETEAERDARMAWFREARFGMFIHWGVYAVPAGTYRNEPIPGISEWIMLRGEIPVSEYKAYAADFNPTEYDPTYWAELAKNAGMRYIVITAKHHDGFALFPSAVSDWDIADASPYGEDLIGPLAKAARAEGLKFGLYYSQAQDWIHPGGAKFRPYEEPEGWDPAQRGSFDSYLEEIAAPQVGEILTRYQPDILWWDTPQWMNQERAERLIPLIRVRPDIIHNNRLGGGFHGDTETPEQFVPATGFPNRDWEVCMTMNDSWGYKSYDDNWKSTEDLIKKLCDIVSKGGNFLLNIGPDASGAIPQPSVERLKAIGEWMEVNSESIYGTTASPFHRLPWGRATKKAHSGGTSLFLHVFDWPDNGKLVVPGLKNIPASAKLLEGGKNLSFEQGNGSLQIHLPPTAPDPFVSVIRLDIKGPLEVEAIMPVQADDGSLELTPIFADLHNSLHNPKLILAGRGEELRLSDWGNRRSWASWTFSLKRPGRFIVSAEIRSPEASFVRLGASEDALTEAPIATTGDTDNYVIQELGTVTYDRAGRQQIQIRPIRDAGRWKPIELRRAYLTPIPNDANRIRSNK